MKKSQQGGSGIPPLPPPRKKKENGREKLTIILSGILNIISGFTIFNMVGGCIEVFTAKHLILLGYIASGLIVIITELEPNSTSPPHQQEDQSDEETNNAPRKENHEKKNPTYNNDDRSCNRYRLD